MTLSESHSPSIPPLASCPRCGQDDVVEHDERQEITMQRKVLVVLLDVFMTRKQRGSRRKGKAGIGHREHWHGAPQVLGKCP